MSLTPREEQIEWLLGTRERQVKQLEAALSCAEEGCIFEMGSQECVRCGNGQAIFGKGPTKVLIDEMQVDASRFQIRTPPPDASATAKKLNEAANRLAKTGVSAGQAAKSMHGLGRGLDFHTHRAIPRGEAYLMGADFGAIGPNAHVVIKGLD